MKSKMKKIYQNLLQYKPSEAVLYEYGGVELPHGDLTTDPLTRLGQQQVQHILVSLQVKGSISSFTCSLKEQSPA